MDKKIVSLHPASHDEPKLVISPDDEVCVNCAHCYRDAETAKQGACRRYPPTVLAIPQQNPLTGQMAMTIQSISAPVPLNYWCGDFEPSIDTPIE